MGCKFGAKQSLDLNYIKLAKENGALFRPNCEAIEIEKTEEGYVTKYIDPHGEISYIISKILILAGGALGTAHLLLRSKKNLKNLSPQVGKNINTNGDYFEVGIAPEGEFLPETYKGRADGGVLCYEFWKDYGFIIEIITLYPIEVVTAKEIKRKEERFKAWGLEHKRLMKEWGKRFLNIAVQGLVPSEGEMKIDEDGFPVLSLKMSEKHKKFYERAREIIKHIVEKNGGEFLETRFILPDMLGTVHPLGSCRMGENPENSVCDENGEVWGYPGMFVTDGAVIPSGLGVNSAHTISAVAEMISEYIIEKYG